jgi:hypothetical protein
MEELRLIYVLKIGKNTKGEGLYEFIFSKNPSNVEPEEWGWTQMPANGNAEPPDEKFIDLILSLKTKMDFIVLHDSNDRTYMDGYYTIHALAYQNVEDQDSDLMFDELPILVFHYGMKLKEVQDNLYTRDLLFKEIPIEKSESVVTINDEYDDEEEEMIV